MVKSHFRALLLALIATVICAGCDHLHGSEGFSPRELYFIAIFAGLAGSPKARSPKAVSDTSGSFATDGSLVSAATAGFSATDVFLVTGGAVNMPTAEL
jgi:hypothetical protein